MSTLHSEILEAAEKKVAAAERALNQPGSLSEIIERKAALRRAEDHRDKLAAALAQQERIRAQALTGGGCFLVEKVFPW